MSAEIDGESREGERKVGRRQCGVDKREKKWVSRYFAFAFAESVASISRPIRGPPFSFFVRPLPLSSFSSRDGPMDERSLSFRTIVRLQNSHWELSLWKRAHSQATLVRGYLALYKYKENTNTTICHQLYLLATCITEYCSCFFSTRFTVPVKSIAPPKRYRKHNQLRLNILFFSVLFMFMVKYKKCILSITQFLKSINVQFSYNISIIILFKMRFYQYFLI